MFEIKLYTQGMVAVKLSALHLPLLVLAALVCACRPSPRPVSTVPDRYAEHQKLLDEIAWPSHEPLMFLRRHGGGDVDDWFELDPGYAAGLSETGTLVSEIRTYKVGQSLGVPFDFEAETELRMAEYMAFNFQKETPGFGINGGFRELIWAQHQFRYFDFFKEYDEKYYRGARSTGDVAILRGYASMANNNSSVHRATVLAEQVLIQHKIPFHIISDRHLANLQQYRVLL